MNYECRAKTNSELNSIIYDCEKRTVAQRRRKEKHALFRSIANHIHSIQLSNLLKIIKK